MTQIHYENPKLVTSRLFLPVNEDPSIAVSLDRHDTTGIRFYIGKELRQHDIGYLSFGTDATAYGLIIPPGVDRFVVHSYCPVDASHVCCSRALAI